MNGWLVEVVGAFGHPNPTEAELASAQAELQTLAIVPPPPARPEPPNGYPSPSLATSEGWHTFTSADIPDHHGDGFASASTLPLPPQRTEGCPDVLVDALGEGEILVCVQLQDSAWAPLPPNQAHPAAAWPLTVATLLLEPPSVWPNARQWDLQACVNGQYIGVSVYIGGLDPGASAIAAADAELATLVIPVP